MPHVDTSVHQSRRTNSNLTQRAPRGGALFGSQRGHGIAPCRRPGPRRQRRAHRDPAGPPRRGTVGISAKPALVSGQELGWRLSAPARLGARQLDLLRQVPRPRPGAHRARHPDGARPCRRAPSSSGMTTARRRGAVRRAGHLDGGTNGFWRQPSFQSADDIGADSRAAHDRLADATFGDRGRRWRAAVSSAANVGQDVARASGSTSTSWRARPGRHTTPGVERRRQPPRRGGGRLHLGAPGGDPRRVRVRSDHQRARRSGAPGTPDVGRRRALGDRAGAAQHRLVARGAARRKRLRPRHLRSYAVPGHPGVFAVGDVAPPTRCRSSARNRADGLLANNIRAPISQGDRCAPTARRSGDGVRCSVRSRDGLEVSRPTGAAFTFPAWPFDRVLMPLIVRWGIYRGVREIARSAGG